MLGRFNKSVAFQAFLLNKLPTMRALLLIDVIFVVVVMAVPICAWQTICGEQLVETVSMVCSTRGYYSHRVSKRDAELFQDERAAKSFLGTHIGSRQRRRTGRIATECCERICSYDIVESYCNPWPVVEDRDDPMLGPVAPGRVRQDKSADADDVFQDTVDLTEENAVIQREEGELIEALEMLDNEYGDGDNVLQQPEEAGEGEAELQEKEGDEEQIPFPLLVPTKKRRRVEGRKSRENSRDRSSKSEERNKKKSGSREGGRSSRRRGKSSRSKKGRDGRERSKRWEALVTSHPPTKDIMDALRSAFIAASHSPYRNIMQNSYTVDEKRDTEILRRPTQAFSMEPKNENRISQPDDDSTLAALYHLAVRLRGRRD